MLLTTFDLDEYVFGALKAGASGFLLKDTPPADLLAGIATVAAGDALLSPSVTRQLIEEYVRRPQAVPRPGTRWKGSPTASWRCSHSSPAGCRTRRSPSTSTSARPRPRRTSSGC